VITANQLVAHLVGDYLLQSDYMATGKTRSNTAALLHAFTYTLPFLFLSQQFLPLLVIGYTHFVIDRWRLARYVVFAKNFLAPRAMWPRWEDCKETGYHKDRPAWLAVWLLIIADNTLHILINGLALRYL
jgi:hypothetical protein